MSKKLIITGITSCMECPAAREEFTGSENWSCSNQTIEFKSIQNVDSIPDWCPLEDE